MEIKNNLGIWMDHSFASLIDIQSNKKNQSIVSKFTFDTMTEALNRSENLMHNKRQQMQKAYYKEIADEIIKYNNILLFGPTNAKVELNNILVEDLHFKDISITVKSADNMSENEKMAFVKEHFNKK